MARAVRRLPRRRTRSSPPELERIIAGKLPEGWDREVPKFHASGSMTATRKSSRDRAPVGGGARPRAGRRLGRPRALDADADRRTAATSSAARTAGATSTSGSASTRWARSSTGSTLHYLRAFGATFFIVQRLHARLDPAGRADAAAVDLRVHARLDRPRRGRPDAPADRAARGAAGDAGAARWSGRPTRTRPRSPGSYAIASTDHADRARAVAPGRSRPGTRRRSPTTRSSAARTCCATRTTSPTRRI